MFRLVRKIILVAVSMLAGAGITIGVLIGKNILTWEMLSALF